MTKPRFVSGADVFGQWEADILDGVPPERFVCGHGCLAEIQIGPGLVTLLGGAPGGGKTALACQMVFDALRLDPDLRATICNVEMSIEVLLERQLARLSGVPLGEIRERRVTSGEIRERVEIGLQELKGVLDRVAFVRPPFDLSGVAATADDFGSRVIVLDYLQRIAPGGEHRDKRSSVDATMSIIRQFADDGQAVIAVAAVSRGRSANGQASYANLNLASFRESSELEFGADDAFLLLPDSERDDLVHLKHVKARHSEPTDRKLRFTRCLQRFEDDMPVDLFGDEEVIWNGH